MLVASVRVQLPFDQFAEIRLLNIFRGKRHYKRFQCRLAIAHDPENALAILVTAGLLPTGGEIPTNAGGNERIWGMTRPKLRRGRCRWFLFRDFIVGYLRFLAGGKNDEPGN